MRVSKLSILALAVLLAALSPVRIAAQSFGFGSEGETAAPAPTAASAAAASPISIHGELTLGSVLFPEDLSDPSSAQLENASRIKLNLSAEGSAFQAALRLKVAEPALDASTAADFLDEAVDEAYLRLFFGTVTVEGGLRKVVWGKADSQGPLDVLNPYDRTDLTITDDVELKIARPMLRAVVALSPMSKLDAVFLPSFEPLAIDFTGRWQPAAIAATLAQGYTILPPPDTSTLEYAQGGLRFTTTAGSVDWGVQYFYGYLPTPAFIATGLPPDDVSVAYNRYHQIGADAAAVLGGFNFRAELAGNITQDLSGDDPYVYNPAVAFSLGADRNIWLGINLNLQYAGTRRLMDGQIVSPFDVEAGSDPFSSLLTAVAYQNLFRDKLQWRVAVLWSPSDADFLLIPSLAWTEGDAEVKLAAGIFGGDEAGQMGQYRDASYLKLTLTYTF